tara:strand:- start:11017 stop:12435 length:1419 start_codon:yes stop_codon:yes gene_type:complete
MDNGKVIRLFQLSNVIQYITSFICISIIISIKGIKIYGEFAILLQYAAVILVLSSIYTPASVIKQFIILDSSDSSGNKKNLNEMFNLFLENILLFFLISIILFFFTSSFSISCALFFFCLLSLCNHFTPIAYEFSKAKAIPKIFILFSIISVLYFFLCCQFLSSYNLSKILIWGNIVGLLPNSIYLFLLVNKLQKANLFKLTSIRKYFTLRPTNKKFSLYLNEVLIFLYNRFDGVVLASVSTPEVFALYSVLWKSIEAPQFIIGNVNNFLFSTDYYAKMGSLSKHIELNAFSFRLIPLKKFKYISKAAIKNLKNNKLNLESARLIKSFALVIFSVIFLLIYFSITTGNNLLIFSPLILLILLIIFIGLWAGSILLALNNTRLLLLRGIVGGSTAILTAIILVPKLGLIGSIVSSLISYGFSITIPIFVNNEGMSTFVVAVFSFLLNIKSGFYGIFEDIKNLLKKISKVKKIF